MGTVPRSRRTATVLVLWLVVASLTACLGPKTDRQKEPSLRPSEQQPTSEAAERSGRRASQPVSSRQGVEAATVRIVAQGSFVDPEVGMRQNAVGQGSGFFIDPRGLIVTNNHVVTGAALVKVYVSGRSEPLNARVVAASECADLALIDVEGADFPYLAWYDEEIETGLDVYAAGYPLGDPTFTLTRGIVSKERASGKTNWAAVDDVLEHDANTNPGSSGGPLVTEDGRVVAVNYAGRADTRQQFAIAARKARRVVEQLMEGRDVESLGINGQAVTSDEGFSGIWVAAVKSGSPADKTGIQAGDVLTKLEGLVLATDGSMGDYCDILRSHLPSDTLSVEVLRYSSQETLAGQINGRQLEPVTSFARELGTGEEPPSTEEAEDQRRYVTVTDDTEAIRLVVPADWTDVDGSPYEFDDGSKGAAVAASPDLDEFYWTYEVPGVIFVAVRDLAGDTQEILDTLTSDEIKTDCTFVETSEYEDPLYRGHYSVYKDCEGGDASVILLAAQPADQAFITFVLVQVRSDADLEALDRILRSFQVVGDLP